MRVPPRRLALLLLSLPWIGLAPIACHEPGLAVRAAAPTRRDLGDLIVLEVSGSYEEMGRQEAVLLGPDLRRVYAQQLADYQRGLAQTGVAQHLLDAVALPLWSEVGGWFEDSHFHEELAGMAAGLGVPRRNLLRALLSLGGGSTVFAATRSATADGKPLLGRNVDWDDALGTRRPLVVRLHPNDGDLEHLFVGWPLVGLPTVGLNEAGFALSFNYFETEPEVGLLLPQWPHRRALQKARTVEEGIRLFLGARERGISSFTVMADASGDVAMVECTPDRCAVFRPEGDWFAQSNHARTPEMIARDRYRSPDSFDRRAGMERAVARHLPGLTPEAAVEILRDRSMHRWPNASNVANLAVLNAVVVQPASRTLWHSTAMQPFAPFGEFVGFTLAKGSTAPPSLPASPWLGSPAMERERAAVEQARSALHALFERRPADAQRTFAALLAETPPVLDDRRLALGEAYARFEQTDFAGAAAAVAPATAAGAPIDVQIYGLSLRALCADRLGRRADAVALHRAALALIQAHPEWNVFEPVAALARQGIAGALVDREPVLFYYALRVPF